jgi:hypothetical protein
MPFPTLRVFRREGDPIEVVTPTYHARYELGEAVRIAGRRRVVRLAHPDDLHAELRWRWQWLDARGYQPTVHEAAVPTLGSDDQLRSAHETPAPTFGAPAHTTEKQAVEAAHTMPTDTHAVQHALDGPLVEPVRGDDEQPVTFGAADGN